MQPKLRAIEVKQVWQGNRPALLLHDRQGLSEQGVVLPAALAPLLALMDGTRDLSTLQTAFELRAGFRLPTSSLEQLIGQLDEVLLLDSPKFRTAYQDALREYRTAPYRAPALAGHSYPADGDALEREFENYMERVHDIDPTDNPNRAVVRGIVVPHIDYQRGGTIYAQVWKKAAEAVSAAEVMVILGTDHNDTEPSLTLTRQSYATPWGVVPTARAIVDAVAEAMGPEAAFANELNHRREHSLELAVNWIHYLRRQTDYEIVPVLCGSFQSFIDQQVNPMENAALSTGLETLRQSTINKRTLVIAAADLAHVGPAFGDPYPYGLTEKATVARCDEELLKAICSGQPHAFLAPICAEQDRRRICGVSPIYLAMQLIGPVHGETVSYAQCPADANGGSVVTIAGIVFAQ